MEKISVGRLIHEGHKTVNITTNPVAINQAGPGGMYLSAARKATTSYTNKAKINYAAVVLEYILTGRIAVLEGSTTGQVYVEMREKGSETVTESAFFTGGAQIHWNREIPANSSHRAIPFVLFAISRNSDMEETKKLFETAVSEFQDSGRVKTETMLQFCDAFYFEWKQYYADEIQIDEFMDENIIRQAIRTSSLEPFQIFSEYSLATPEIQIAEVAKKKDETSTRIKDDDKFEACKRGEYRLDHCWDLERETSIPSIDKLEGFVPSESFYTLVDLISSELGQVIKRMDSGEYGVEAIKNNYVNSILVGKPGTGKTTLANALGATFGMPVRTVTVSKNAEEDLYQGMTKVAEGGFKFVETPFLDVYKNGGIILLEEFNLSDPAVMMGALGQAIEKPFILYEDGYKEVRRHPLCVIISTMNTATQGSREPSEAFTSRSADVFMLDDPDEAAFINILQINGYNKSSCKKVYNAYAKIIAFLTSSSVNAEDVAMSVTLRHCLAALRQMKIGRSFKQALRNTIVGTIAIKDITLANQVYSSVIEPLRD